MSALSRFGPVMARSMLAQQHRQMASAAVATDPIQKLFLEKIRESKSSNKGLDATHEKLLKEEMLRLKRVYSIQDESSLAKLEHKFDQECEISLRDIDTSKELRHKIQTGQHLKELASQTKPVSDVLATMPDQTRHEFFLPPVNKPDPEYLLENQGVPEPPQLDEPKPDFLNPLEKITPKQLERQLNVCFGDNMPTVQDDGPERDKVNFPRIPQPLDTPPTRGHIIPEAWFQFFYPKTGVTGPYTFAATFGTFLMSKEWLIVDHESFTGFSSLVIFAWAIPKFGPRVKKWLVDGVKQRGEDWNKWQRGHIEVLDASIDHYKHQLKSADIIEEMYAARRHDIDLQLEVEYRTRLKKVYDDTKRRLNYLVAVANSQRQIHHSNLVNTVISNVLASLGPKQEAEVLDDCIVNLKILGKRHANAI